MLIALICLNGRSRIKNQMSWDWHLSSILDIYIEYAGELSAMKFSKAVDAKLNKLLRFPEIGFPEPRLVDRKYFYRATIIQGNYKMIYYVDNDIIWVVAFWDMRMNPEKLKRTI